MSRLDRLAISLTSMALIAWFILPISKMLAFILAGDKSFGPDITAGHGPNDLGWRLILGGGLLFIGGVIAYFAGDEGA